MGLFSVHAKPTMGANAISLNLEGIFFAAAKVRFPVKIDTHLWVQTGKNNFRLQKSFPRPLLYVSRIKTEYPFGNTVVDRIRHRVFKFIFPSIQPADRMLFN